jgi:hypothetical protein
MDAKLRGRAAAARLQTVGIEKTIVLLIHEVQRLEKVNALLNDQLQSAHAELNQLGGQVEEMS